MKIKDLIAAIKSVPTPYNEVLFLHYVNELPVKKTAALLERKVSTVKMQLVRGKKLLLQGVCRQPGAPEGGNTEESPCVLLPGPGQHGAAPAVL